MLRRMRCREKRGGLRERKKLLNQSPENTVGALHIEERVRRDKRSAKTFSGPRMWLEDKQKL